MFSRQDLFLKQGFHISTSQWCILDDFAILQRAAISFFMFVCPSAWNNSASTERIFIKFGIWVFFENLSEKFKFD
jgi:hypothetical protein